MKFQSIIPIVFSVMFFCIFAPQVIADNNVRTGDHVVTILSESGHSYVGSVKKEYWDQAMTFLTANNMKALQEMLDTNKIFLVQKEIKGSVLEQSVWTGWAKVKVSGREFIFYVSRDALK